MTPRRTQAVDAAIRVLGTRGLRQLTHRAADAEAGLPAGSTSNYFRTREALVNAVVTRLGELDRHDWQQLAGGDPAAPSAPLAVLLARFVAQATGPERHRTLARQALFVEAAVDPRLREPLIAGWQAVQGWAGAWLRQRGFADPAQASQLILEHLDGLILHRLALGETRDPTPQLAQLVAALPREPGRPEPGRQEPGPAGADG